MRHVSGQDTTTDRAWMTRALALAERARGRVAPNPAVGAVLARDGAVVGEGWTMPPGGPHAERVALDRAGARARGATLYVTLEPCAHHGRTPPCADALAAAGIARAVIAARDPHPLVNGRGIERLRAAGVEVSLGLMDDEAIDLNLGFFKRVLTSLPEVTAKFAMSLDGRIASHTGHSRWITGDEARYAGHRLRDRHDAILVGIGTVLADDPALTTRLDVQDAGDGGPHHPLRVVVDSSGRTPPNARLLSPDTPGGALIAVTARAPGQACRALEAAGAEVAVLPERDGRVDLAALLRHLGERGVNSVLVEGGGRVLGALFDAGLVDRVAAFVAPIVIGGAGAPAPVAGLGVERVEQAPRLANVTIARLGADLMITGRLWSGRPAEQWEEMACSAASSRRSARSYCSTALEVTTP